VTLPIDEIVVIQKHDLVISLLKVNGLKKEVCLQNLSLSLQPNTGKLFIFGGATDKENAYTSDGLQKSSSIYKISPRSLTMEEIKIPKIYAAKAAVAAVSSVWFGEKSLLIYGGTEPAIREGGRSIFLLRSS